MLTKARTTKKKLRKLKQSFPKFERYEADKAKMVLMILSAKVINGMTFRELANKAGCSPNTIKRLDTGYTWFPRLDTLWKLADAANIKNSIFRGGK